MPSPTRSLDSKQPSSKTTSPLPDIYADPKNALVMLATILISVSLIFVSVALWDRQIVNALAWILPAIPVYLMLGTELIGRANYYADRLRIEITKGQILNQAVETQQRGEPRFFMTLWQGKGLPYPSLLIFDESDELLLSDALQSAAWRERTKSQLVGYFQNCAIGIQSLGDHFYLFECRFMLADQPAR